MRPVNESPASRTHPIVRRLAERRRVLMALGCSVLFVTAAGCVNLAAIREFADISSESVRYRALVEDYVASPERRSRYAPSGQCPECTTQVVARKAQEPGLLLMQVTVQAYMESLGKLAADEVVDYSKEYGDLSSAITAAKFATKEESEALTKIAELLTRATTDLWRRKQLRELIGGTNASLQTVLTGLQEVARAFELESRNEELAASDFYRGLIRQSRDPAGIAAVQDWANVRRRENGLRREAIAAYHKVLGKIRDGHQRLYEDRNDLASKANLALMKSYAKELRSAYKTLQDLRS